MSFFSKLSVSARLYVAFGTLTALVAIVGAIGYLGVVATADILVDYRLAARQTLEINDYDADVSRTRIEVLRYLNEPSAEQAKVVNVWIDDVATTDADGFALFANHPEDVNAIEEVTALAEEYRATFAKLVAANGNGDTVAFAAAKEGLQKLGDQMQVTYDEMAERAEALQNTLGPKAASTAQFDVALVLTAAAIGCLIGIATAIAMGRWFSRALRKMTTTMRSMSQGDLEQTITGTEANHELGQMARALEVFQTDGRAARQAEAEKALRAEAAAKRAQTMQRFQATFDEVIGSAVVGDFSARIDSSFDDPDLDRVAGNFDRLLETLSAALGEAGTVLAALARADLTSRMEGSYEGAFASLKTSTNAVADKLNEIVGQLRNTSSSLKLATGEILAGANDLSERTTKQAATIEETSAAMEQLATTVMQNAKRANEASATARRVTDVAEQSGTVMAQATEAMDRITQSSAKISNIIGLIDDIAFQTNLLALNASVEAARAGDAGKGFAVVAIEVRRLAQSAASASSEVKVLIEQSGTEVAGGTRLVAEAASRLTEMLGGVRSTSGLMDGIATDSQEQAQGIGEVTTAVRQMDEMTQHNAALVEEMNAAIEQTEGQATQLDGIVDMFVVSGGLRVVPSTSTRPAPTAPSGKPPGIRALQAKVKAAASSYLAKGNTAVARDDWSEF